MQRFLRKPSPSMVVACLALFVALSGVGSAATRLARNSVGTRQIINGAIQKIDMNKKTVAALKGRAGRGACRAAVAQHLDRREHRLVIGRVEE